MLSVSSGTTTPCVRAYAPLSCQIVSRRASSSPSAANAPSTFRRCSREWFGPPRVLRPDGVLGATLDPLDRPAQRAGEPGDEHVLGVELAAHAEAAAGVGRPQRDPVLLHAEQAGEDAPVEVRHLRRAPDREPVEGRVVVGDEAARLERDGGMPADVDLDLDDVRGALEGAVDVAV